MFDERISVVVYLSAIQTLPFYNPRAIGQTSICITTLTDCKRLGNRRKIRSVFGRFRDAQ